MCSCNPLCLIFFYIFIIFGHPVFVNECSLNGRDIFVSWPQTVLTNSGLAGHISISRTATAIAMRLTHSVSWNMMHHIPHQKNCNLKKIWHLKKKRHMRIRGWCRQNQLIPHAIDLAFFPSHLEPHFARSWLPSFQVCVVLTR